MANVMIHAWEIARKGQSNFGGKVKEYFAQALRMAWAIFKKEDNKMDYASQVKGTIKAFNVPELKGSDKQVKWANDIRINAVNAMEGEVLNETYIQESLLPGGKSKEMKRPVRPLYVALQSEDNIKKLFEDMENDGLPTSQKESTVKSLNNMLDRYNRMLEILSNADATFWIDNRDNQSKNYRFEKFNKYVRTGVKEY